MSELEEKQLDELAVLEKHNLGLQPSYNELMTAQLEEKDITDIQVIFKKQKEYLDADIEYMKGQRKQLKTDANHIKSMRNGGHPFEGMGVTLHINQVIRTLNEKFNHNSLYLGHRPYHIDEQLFYLNNNYNIEFFDGYSAIELHTNIDACDSFKATYDIAVKKLKAHVEESEFLDEEDKAFYLTF